MERDILLATIHKPPARAWSETVVIELLNFRNKSLMAGDLNAKNPVWNGRVSKLSGDRLLDLADNDFQISAPQCPTHYTPQGNGDVLDNVLHRNIRLSDVTISDILDSDHLPTLFHILDHVSARDISAPVEMQTVSGFGASPLTLFHPGSKLILLMKLKKQLAISHPL
jgi:hypothetical protein